MRQTFHTKYEYEYEYESPICDVNRRKKMKM